MSEKPILFKGPMVRKILSGEKTQTRRIMKVQPPSIEYRFMTLTDSTSSANRRHIGKHHWATVNENKGFPEIIADDKRYFRCPYEVGDEAWVRETWRTWPEWDCIRPSELEQDSPIEYRADRSLGLISTIAGDNAKWRPSIFMPKQFSRFKVLITGIRWEWLQDITPADALAEGVDYEQHYEGLGNPCDEIRMTESFHDLWDSINARRGFGWDTNPAVWVYTFERIDK